METAARSLIGRAQEGELALAAYDCMARTFTKIILRAAAETRISRVLLAGGVASSSLLRRMLGERLADKNIQLFFALPALSSDNAVGVALLGMDKSGKDE
ncbi:tRNA N6-adenosine threonylcarbamoyltransferase [bioreactor metagenome]|uniref:tRNA N6-adenosine threonylcarbamoyltransferase n=1 Tax=bioreactor metagenome TaxID=1076179 RepID=A0A645IYZ6_9ZZZZ